METLRKAITDKMSALIPEQLIIAIVTEVDEGGLTCTCRTVNDDIDLYNVSLTAVSDEGASEIVTIPEIDSPALVAIIQNDLRNSYMVSCHKAAKIIIRGGALGGLVKVKELQSQLDKTNKLLQAVINIVIGTPIPEPGNSSPSALQIALKAAIGNHTLGKFDKIENEKVVHG